MAIVAATLTLGQEVGSADLKRSNARRSASVNGAAVGFGRLQPLRA
jgi:hypothetical protein